MLRASISPRTNSASGSYELLRYCSIGMRAVVAITEILWFTVYTVSESTARACRLVAPGLRVRVIPRLVADIEFIGRGARDGHCQAVEARARHLVVRIVADQILRAQIVAHFFKGFIQATFTYVE